MSGDVTVAFRRDLPESERRRAEALWPVASDIRATISMISAAGVLLSAGRMSAPSYRSCIRQACSRLDSSRVRLGSGAGNGHAVRLLAAAAANLGRSLERASSHPGGAHDTLLLPLLDAYRASREMGAGLWALELRPEGLPLRNEAREVFDEALPDTAFHEI